MEHHYTPGKAREAPVASANRDKQSVPGGLRAASVPCRDRGGSWRCWQPLRPAAAVGSGCAPGNGREETYQL